MPTEASAFVKTSADKSAQVGEVRIKLNHLTNTIVLN